MSAPANPTPPGEGLSPDRFAQVERLFQRARRLSAGERDAFLDEVSADDPSLAREVRSLLDQFDEDCGAFLSDSALGDPLDLEAFAAAPERSPAAPSRLGNYRILRKLGEGGMGVVYLAEQAATKRRVALKLIHAFAPSPMLLRRFEREARALGRLRHPGIAQVYEAGFAERDDGIGGQAPFIAMELVEGSSITEFAAAHDLSLEQRLELMVRVCEAVQHAHEQGVIHRDLKPANILVDDCRAGTGERPQIGHQPKILDFGIARLAAVGDADHTALTMQTRTGQLIGTLQYMSPEQAAGDSGHAAPIDTRTDVYSLGVVLYELIAGRLPLDLRDAMVHEAVRTIRDDDPPPLSSVNPRFRGDLTTIVGKAMEKEPQRRYQCAADLAAELTRFLRDEPIVAHRPSALYQLRKFARRNRAIVVSSLIITGALAVAAVFATRQALVATAAQARAEEHFADAHELARAMLFEIDQALVNVPGALPARRMLVERGLSYLDRIATQEGHDPEVLWEVAAAYIAIGDVQGDTQRPNIGDVDGAMASYRRAAALLDAFREEMPRQSRATLFLAVSKIGDQLALLGHACGAMEQYERALAIALENGRRSDEATAMARLADALATLGRSDEARRMRMEADAIAQEVLEADPGNAALRREFAVSHFKRGMEQLQADPAAALDAFTRFTGVCEELAEAHPHNAVYRRDVAVGAQRIGHALEALGRAAEALPHYERELAIMEALAAADPENEQARIGMLAPCCKIGEAHLSRGDLTSSLHYFKCYLETARVCAERNPLNAAVQRDLGVAYYKRNEWHARQANDESLERSARLSHWSEAREWLVRCRDQFLAMERSGTLGPGDADVPESIAAEIASCDEAIARLER